MYIPISVRLSKELIRKLDRIADEMDKPRSFIIKRVLESYLKEYSDLQAALYRLQDTTDPVISGNKMREYLVRRSK
ncbi:MAG: ribbon-helix-helix domain-containing protein [Candidatus Latescibacter sp.]|nr:ribbon-helix-helix domain-containing protein [Candidatus Latescibacter sp.]